MLQYAVLYLCGINVFAFLAFGHDKRAARVGERRVSESSLLLLSLVGGSIGAFAGRAHFRHKTRKQPFSTQLQVIAMLQVGVLFGLAAAFASIG